MTVFLSFNVVKKLIVNFLCAFLCFWLFNLKRSCGCLFGKKNDTGSNTFGL